MIRVGQKLRETRVQKKLSIEDVAKATKIRPAFLTAIEKGDYEQLPSSAYAIGFVRNYASFLGLPEQQTLALFRREFDEEKAFRVLPEGMAQKEFPLQRFRTSQAWLVVSSILVFLFAYLLFQSRYAILPPPLTVDSPKENEVYNRDITISGKTDESATVVVNDVPVSLGIDGTFTKKVTLFPGKGKIIIKARNRFGKETVVERTITVQ